MVLIKLKWNKITYDDVQINVEDGALAFKKKVYELTRVPIDRQKLMAKGAWVGILKDDTDLTKVKLTEASQVLLMGSAEVIAEPTETVKFFEDMSSQERAETGVTVPSGLVNLGNTCYMNSTIQCLRRIPELRGPPLNSGDMNSEFSRSFQNTMSLLDSSEASIPPYEFVSKLRNFFPQFAERGQSGNYMQQDAEEFFNVLANSLAMGMPNGNGNIDQLMGLRLEEKLVCEEAPDSEPPVINHVSINKIICNIQGGPGTTPVDHLSEGIKLGLEGTVEKHSSVLGRDALWKKSSRISSLPKYICFHFMRFFWKATPESRDHTGVKCKILRAVNFSDVIDMYEFCTNDLQAKLRKNREDEDKRFEEKMKSVSSTILSVENSSGMAMESPRMDSITDKTDDGIVVTNPLGESKEDMEVEDLEDEDAEALKAALSLSMSVEPSAIESTVSENGFAFGNGLPRNFTGLYELHSLVTHKGRSADSGHYIGWVRQAPGSTAWWQYNDDVVSEATTQDIMLLKGGGDRDMVYLAFYRYKESKN